MKSKSNIAAGLLPITFGFALVLFFSLSLFATGALAGGCSGATEG